MPLQDTDPTHSLGGLGLRLIIDTDPGVDDAIAILMVLTSPSLEVMGLTTVGGNVPLARATRNALALLDYAERSDVPVARGSARPSHGRFGYSYAVHGASGLTRRLPRPKTRPVDARAVDFLATLLRKHPGQITLVALGPLTNLAWLCLRHPGSLEQASSLVIMGGTANVPGNVTRFAEFNFYSDPEAARLVLSSGVPLTLAGLGACRQVGIGRQEAGQLRARSLLGRLAVQLITNWFRRQPQRERFEFYDPSALAAAVDPEIVTTYQASLTVETGDPVRLGSSLVTAPSGPAAVAHQVDERRFFRLLSELLKLAGLN